MGWQDAPVTESKGWQSAPTVSPTSEIPTERREWSDVLGSAVFSIPESGLNLLGGLGHAVMHPIQTAGTALDIAAGGLQNALPKPIVDFVNKFDFNPEAAKQAVLVANQVGGQYAKDYGSLEGFKNKLAADPVNVFADFSTLASGGGTAATKLASVVRQAPAATLGVGMGAFGPTAARVAEAVAPVVSAPVTRPIANALDITGRGLTKAGQYTNPLAPVMNAVGFAGQVAGKGLGYAQRAVEPILPGGAEAIKSRAYIDALSKDPNQITQAVSMLESGLPIELVATKLNSPGLAALAATSQNASTAIKQLYILRDKAIAETQANKLTSATQNLNQMQNQFAGQVLNPSQMEVGKTLTTERAALERKARKEIVTPAYNKAFEKAPEPFSFAPVETKAKQLQSDISTRLNPEIAPNTSEVLKIFGSKVDEATGAAAPTMVTLEDADKLIKALNADLSGLHGNTDARMTVRNLKELKAATEEAINAGVPEEASKLYKQARTLHKEKVVEPFLKGWVANLSREGATGTQILAPSAVTKKILSSEEDAMRAVAAFNDSPTALQAIKNGIEGEYRNAVVTGTKSHDKWMAEHQYELAALDRAGLGLTQRLESFGGQAKELSNVRSLLDKAQAKLPQNKLDSAKHLQTLTQGLPEVRAVVQQIQSELDRGVSFEQLAAKGKEAGGGVLGLASKAAGPTVASLSHEMTLYNTITNRLKGKLNEKLAAEIAVAMLDAPTAAKAIKQAQAYSEKSAARKVAIGNELARYKEMGKSKKALIANRLGEADDSSNGLRIEVIGGGGQQ